MKGLFILFTGLSGSGKSTLSDAINAQLKSKNIASFQLDGDVLRNGLNSDLGFSHEDRTENIRRTAELGKLLLRANQIVLASFISPYEKDRLFIKNCISSANYMQIYMSAPLEICEKRDIKGLYKKARKGEILNFTGITAPYEIPKDSDLLIDSSFESLEKSTNRALSLILNHPNLL